MAELLTSAQMRGLEQDAMARGDVTGLDLMERAGQGVFDAVIAQWPDLADSPRRAVALCGPGNNGGDGFVVARLLQQAGWDVEVLLYGTREKLPPDARVNYDRWSAIGPVRALTDDVMDGYAEAHAGTVLAIDALFGSGLTRPFTDLGRVQDELNYWALATPRDGQPRVVSIDVPSGLCADSGRYLGYDTENPTDMCILANLTVTFHRAKCGHYLRDGPGGCGNVVCVDIGLDAMPPDDVVILADRPDVSALSKRGLGHKFTYGHALVLSGGPARTGAARLAARGALRIGAGLVTLGVPPAAQMEVASHVTAIMIKRLPDAARLRDVLQDTRINALCLGPALGLDSEKTGLIKAALDADRPTVLDADALTLIGGDGTLFRALHAGCILTPHGGEFARLFPDIAKNLNAPAAKGPAYSKADATRAAAKQAGCTVLFKGPDTVIASPDGSCAIHSSAYGRSAPWLATAGSGDILSGFITGLLARGLAPQQAAETGAYLHCETALHFGPGLIAEDIPETLPGLLKTLDL